MVFLYSVSFYLVFFVFSVFIRYFYYIFLYIKVCFVIFIFIYLNGVSWVKRLNFCYQLFSSVSLCSSALFYHQNELSLSLIQFTRSTTHCHCYTRKIGKFLARFLGTSSFAKIDVFFGKMVYFGPKFWRKNVQKGRGRNLQTKKFHCKLT